MSFQQYWDQHIIYPKEVRARLLSHVVLR